MYQIWLPELGFKRLLNFVRERIKHVYRIMYLPGTALKKTALVQASKNTITHTSKLKSISKYQLLKFHLSTFENYEFLSFTLEQLKHNSRTLNQNGGLKVPLFDL